MLLSEGQIGRYQIRRRVATGGMGTLYLAHDPVLDRTVALKLFHGDLERADARDRFVGEARAVAALNHPNIVTIYDYGEYAAQPFLVMEYLQGETLADFISRRHQVPAPITIRWMEELCAAVGYAHERGIIHRDLKPANLMIDAYGRLKVLDFGIARMRGTLASQSTAVIGTPGYVAPEQIRGGTIDHRSDLFSIGVVCYELFSYTEPFAAETAHAVTHRTLNESPPPLDEVRPSIDRDLARIIAAALEKDPAARPQSADKLRDTLASARRRSEAAEPETMVAMYVPPAARGGGGEPADRRTPAPEPTGSDAKPHRRTSREALARQRHEQLQGWIDLAREQVAAGELAEAREACAQALRIEPGHQDAVGILAVLDQMAGVTMLRPRPDLKLAVPAHDEGATVLVPIARGVPQGADAATPVALQPPPREVPADVAVAPAPATRETASRPASPARVSAMRRPVMWLAAAIAVIAVAAAAWWATTNAVPPPPVMVVIDATPWAIVATVERETGEREALPADASTPLALTLVPGTYRVSLVGPSPASEARQIAIRVGGDGAQHVFVERFGAMTADDYFRAAREAATTAAVPELESAGAAP